jgi:hypothetical protein
MRPNTTAVAAKQGAGGRRRQLFQILARSKTATPQLLNSIIYFNETMCMAYAYSRERKNTLV